MAGLPPPIQPNYMPGIPNPNMPRNLPPPILPAMGQPSAPVSMIPGPGSQIAGGSVTSTGTAPLGHQIKVGWFAANSLTVPDIGCCFENICIPGNLVNVEMGQFDSLLTVRTSEDVSRVQKALTGGGVKIKDQVLSEYMVIDNGMPATPTNPSVVAAIEVPPSKKDSKSSKKDDKDREKSRDRRDRDRSRSDRDRSNKERSDRGKNDRDYYRHNDYDRKDKEGSRERERKRSHKESSGPSQNMASDPILSMTISTANKPLTLSSLEQEIQKRKDALKQINEKCDPYVNKAQELYSMSNQHTELIAKKVNLSRKFEAYVLALDKPAEPYMSWLCNEMEKKSTNQIKFRARGVKCAETPLAAEEPYSRSLFEEGALMVIKVNQTNEQKRSVTVHLCMNELNQIHKNMQVRDALSMIQDQWNIYVQHLMMVKLKTNLPPAHMTTTLKWLSEGKNLKISQYDAVLSYIMDKRTKCLRDQNLDPNVYPVPEHIFKGGNVDHTNGNDVEIIGQSHKPSGSTQAKDLLASLTLIANKNLPGQY